jgi:hypothetical protein
MSKKAHLAFAAADEPVISAEQNESQVSVNLKIKNAQVFQFPYGSGANIYIVRRTTSTECIVFNQNGIEGAEITCYDNVKDAVDHVIAEHEFSDGILKGLLKALYERRIECDAFNKTIGFIEDHFMLKPPDQIPLSDFSHG